MSFFKDALVRASKKNLDDAKKLEKDYKAAKTPEEKTKLLKLAQEFKKDVDSQKKDLDSAMKEMYQQQQLLEMQSKVMQSQHDTTMSIIKNIAK